MESGKKEAEYIKYVSSIVDNSKSTWFGLLIVLVFVSVTLLGHKDADFFSYGASTQIPIVSISVPPEAFFFTTPILVAAFYSYLQLYLVSLWQSLAMAPSYFEDQPLIERVSPSVIVSGALWFRDHSRRDGCFGSRPFGIASTAISLLLVWVAGLVVLTLIWTRSMALHNEWMTMVSAVCLFISAIFGCAGLAVAKRKLGRPLEPKEVIISRTEVMLGAFLALFLACVSWATTEGGPFGEEFLYPANLENAEVTQRPINWRAYDQWVVDFEHTFRIRNGISPGEDMSIELWDQFESEAVHRRAAEIISLKKGRTKNADLRNANLTNAFLVGANFENARLGGAIFWNAQMDGANFFLSDDLRGASFEAANLSGAKFTGSYLTGVSFAGANLKRAVFRAAQLYNANFKYANLEGVDFAFAQLEKAKFDGASMAWVNMEGADLSSASLEEAAFGTWSAHRVSSWHAIPTLSVYYPSYSENIDAGLSIGQLAINSAFGDSATILSQNTERPCHWADEIEEPYEIINEGSRLEKKVAENLNSQHSDAYDQWMKDRKMPSRDC